MPRQVTPQPLVFIGSSVENLEKAEAIQSSLQHMCEPWVWHQGIFEMNETAIESLTRTIREKKPDFAIFLVCGEDLTASRGAQSLSPRDNIILELGLFMGALSRHRVFLVVDEAASPKIPSDLAGIQLAKFKPPVRSTIEGALGPACREIKKMIQKLGLIEA
jgi:predicted nucleotide-binding protein